jgi:organic radical activating enzyme
MAGKSEKIAIYGISEFSQKVVKEIIEKKYYNLVALIDKNPIQNTFLTVPVLSAEQAVQQFDNDTKIIIVEEMPYIDEKYLYLYQIGYKKVYSFVKESIWFTEKGKFEESALQEFDLHKKPVLRYFEIHISDNCNLNCKGCTHFANLFHKTELDIQKVEMNFKRLAELFEVSMIRLMGGEPLMSPFLFKCIDIARKYFPNANIFIVTNGLLIPNLSEDTCAIIRENKIKLKISIYKPTYIIIDAIEQFLIKKNIMHFYGNGDTHYSQNMIIQTFHTCLSEPANRKAYVNRVSCYNEYCWFLNDNKLYKCGYPPLSYKLNEVCGTNYICDNDDGFDIFAEENGWNIIQRLTGHIPFCRYCSSKKRKFLWESNRKFVSLDDYIV